MWFAAGLTAFLALWNNVANLWQPFERWYMPVSLAVAAGIVLLSRSAGLGTPELGLTRARVPSGVAWGGGVALAAFLCLGAAVLVPAARPLLADARIAELGAAGVAFRALVRIPFGTALLEEVAFRGALLGAWARRIGWRRAQLVQSAVFGLWHVTPTWIALEANELAQAPAARVGAIGGAVVVSAIGGWLFGWLRGRSGSLLAPLLAHWGLNAAAVTAAAAAIALG
ncbi:CPBP family intramembrane metalloprotease [Egibacter rhizosphaerae]|uniref:CPBP family intramembrane metalloprotease n=1 Tax=Egibacter rhizosphaerae TaxID=1670831 RepID=A0A411YI63_9ACTN|nr:CPBP family intramembrane glutamic endopeptidase [Egibacter rhizosphaerae]QBI20968.1 CPBP family intramembrane metalloprotease [Egibacter rhizosphaerae]